MCAGDYFVAVAGNEGSTGSYTLSVTDITDTSTSIPASLAVQGVILLHGPTIESGL